MKKGNKKSFYSAVILLLSFFAWTVVVSYIDKETIGPCNSAVGFSTLNNFFHNLFGVHFSIYSLTEWLSLIPIGVVLGFGILGLAQWIRRKNLLKVDFNILVLGGFYVLVFLVYIIFEIFTINYRPVLIDGYLEASYPSSTTMLAMCIMPTAIMQFNLLFKNNFLKRCISFSVTIYIVFMVIGRLISGVHWFTDIIGGILLSLALIMIYLFISSLKK